MSQYSTIQIVWFWFIISLCTISAIYIFFFAGMVEKKEKQRAEAQYEEERNKYRSMYEGVDLPSLVGAPNGCYVDDNGYPCHLDSSSLRWGEGYTFFVSLQGLHYHRPDCRHTQITWPDGRVSKILVEFSPAEHVGLKSSLYGIKPFTAKPCRICSPKMPDLQWYRECMKIIKIKEKYHID